MAYNRISPMGGERIDFHMGHLLSTIWNLAVSIHSKGQPKTKKISDFLPSWDGIKEEKVMTGSQIKEFFQAMKERQQRRERLRNKKSK